MKKILTAFSRAFKKLNPFGVPDKDFRLLTYIETGIAEKKKVELNGVDEMMYEYILDASPMQIKQGLLWALKKYDREMMIEIARDVQRAERRRRIWHLVVYGILIGLVICLFAL